MLNVVRVQLRGGLACPHETRLFLSPFHATARALLQVCRVSYSDFLDDFIFCSVMLYGSNVLQSYF
jgi:hypothetical protein